jgi:hypothetical protein
VTTENASKRLKENVPSAFFLQRLRLAAKERQGLKEKARNHNFSFKIFSAFLAFFRGY